MTLSEQLTSLETLVNGCRSDIHGFEDKKVAVCCTRARVSLQAASKVITQLRKDLLETKKSRSAEKVKSKATQPVPTPEASPKEGSPKEGSKKEDGSPKKEGSRKEGSKKK
jgi:hypothetical protein